MAWDFTPNIAVNNAVIAPKIFATMEIGRVKRFPKLWVYCALANKSITKLIGEISGIYRLEISRSMLMDGEIGRGDFKA